MWFPPASLHKFHGPAHGTLPPLQHCCQQSGQYPSAWRVELPHTLLCLAFQASFPGGKTFACMQTSWTSLLPTAIDSPFPALHWICCVKSHQWSLNRNTMFSFSLQCHWPLLHWPLLSSYIYPQLAYTAKPFWLSCFSDLPSEYFLLLPFVCLPVNIAACGVLPLVHLYLHSSQSHECDMIPSHVYSCTDIVHNSISHPNLSSMLKNPVSACLVEVYAQIQH